MKAASIHELKKELLHLDEKSLVATCLRLARYKKDNKELMTYLLFEAHDEEGYRQSIKKEIDDQLAEMNRSSLYFVKKTLRKILRNTNKYIRYSGEKQTTVEVLLYFCEAVKKEGIPLGESKVISNMFAAQIKKIRTTLKGLHEDLQYDYEQQLQDLEAYHELLK